MESCPRHYMNVSARTQIERLKWRRLRNKRLMLRVPLTRAISANISASIVSRVCGCDDGIPIISHMNVYTPNERLLTTQRKEGKIVWCMFIWGCKQDHLGELQCTPRQSFKHR